MRLEVQLHALALDPCEVRGVLGQAREPLEVLLHGVQHLVLFGRHRSQLARGEDVAIGDQHADRRAQLVRGNAQEVALESRGLLESTQIRALTLAHVGEAVGQVAELVAATDAERMVVVAFLHLLRAAHQALDRPQDLLAHVHAGHQRCQQGEQRERHHVAFHRLEERHLRIEGPLHHVELL